MFLKKEEAGSPKWSLIIYEKYKAVNIYIISSQQHSYLSSLYKA